MTKTKENYNNKKKQLLIPERIVRCRDAQGTHAGNPDNATDAWRIHARVQREKGRSLGGDWYITSRESFDTPWIAITSHLYPKAEHLQHRILRVFRLPYQHSRCRLGNPWVRPINAALKRLKLATVTPGAITSLSTSSASLFRCRFSDAFFSSSTHAAINLQPPSHTVLCLTPESSAVMPQSSAIPNIQRSSAT